MTAKHKNPLVSETSESEGIPETLLIYISKRKSPECDARTGNMFGFVGAGREEDARGSSTIYRAVAVLADFALPDT
jgi:hypothetical protein